MHWNLFKVDVAVGGGGGAGSVVLEKKKKREGLHSPLEPKRTLGNSLC